MRVIRALEIFYATGKKKSQQCDKLIPRYSYLAVCPELQREDLYNRIDSRVDIMLERGLVEEVKSLISMGIDKNYQCMQGIGYKETYDSIINNSLDSLAELIKLNSRHYAKRQITFFKKLQGLKFVNSNPKIAVLEVLDYINGFNR